MNKRAAATCESIQGQGLRRSLALAALALAGLSIWGLGRAVEQVSFEVERIDGPGWQAEGIAIQLMLPQRTAATATIARLQVPQRKLDVRNVRVDCAGLDVSASAIVCAKARLHVDASPLGSQSLTGRIAYGRNDGSIDMQLDGVRIGEGTMALSTAMRSAGWDASAVLHRVGIQPLMQLATQLQLPMNQFEAQGMVSGSIKVSGVGDVLRHADIDAKVEVLVANNAEGTLATDQLSFGLRAHMEPSGHDRSFNARFESAHGQAYAQPLFMDFGVHAMVADARGLWRSDGSLQIDEFHIDHDAVAQAQGSALVNLAAEQPLRSLELDLRNLTFPGAYDTYFQPLLLDTSFKALKTNGTIAGRLVVRAGLPHSAELHLRDVSIDDDSRTLIVRSVNGDWFWADAADSRTDDETEESVRVRDSTLSWQSGVLLNLELGAARLRFSTQGRQFRLLEPTKLPLFDGAVSLDSFRIRNAGLPTVAFMVDADIEPINVQQLCRAFGWPEFGGRIGGRISKLRLRDNVITLGTTLEATVFDGRISISDLRLEQPFSTWPRLQSNITLDNLDLNLVTSAFSFGSITGRLSGYINGLKLFNWQPAAFDARLFTPADDRSRHRISQRAVQNIGNIGGGGAGVTAALSSGVMRFFDDFNYDRLGLSCRLENDVCILDGIAPAPNGGYYLVKGKGLPRIDVIGGAHRVDWPRLVQQLIAITESNGPVVQ